MEFIDPKLLAYCETHSSPEDSLLQRLNRETHLKVSQPRMLSGHLQGRLLAMISKLVQPSYILEIGTYTGYSALCLAEGLKPGGKLLSIDVNEENLKFAGNFIEVSPLKTQIELLHGNAIELIPGLSDNIDLVFIDADKENYLKYYELVLPKLRTGGLILSDNVLWSGKVLEDKKDKDTAAIHAFNERLGQDPRVETIILPVRDGISLTQKR